MRRLFAALVPLVLLPLTSTPAHAADTTFYGGCFFNTISRETGPGLKGVWGSRTLLYSRVHGNVVNGTVTCELRVNGVTQAASGTHAGSGVVVFAEPLTYGAIDLASVQLCTIVDFTSDGTPTETRCVDPTRVQVPPPLPNLEPGQPTGGGYNTGTAGVLALTSAARDVTALCAYAVDPATGEVVVFGTTVTQGASSARIRCRLTDKAGTVLYDDSVSLSAPVAEQHTSVNGGTGSITVCTEGVGEWGDHTVAVGLDCRPSDLPLPPEPPPNFEPGQPNGGGYNTGNAGLLVLTSPDRDLVSECAFTRNPATGDVLVAGTTATQAASAARIRCRLTDAAGAVLYDNSVQLSTPAVELHSSVPAGPGPITVCTEGTGIWGDRTITVGLACRPGEPVG